LTGGYLFEILYGLRFGLGLHGADIAFEEMPNVLKVLILWLINTSKLTFR